LGFWLHGQVFRNTKITSGILTDPFTALWGKDKPRLDSCLQLQSGNHLEHNNNFIDLAYFWTMPNIFSPLLCQ